MSVFPARWGSCSVTKSCLTLRLHGLQQARFLCPFLSPGIFSDSCPLSWWCHPTVSFSVTPFSSCLQSFPALESFWMNQLFASGGQSIGASASSSVLPMNIQSWFPLGFTALIFLLSRGLSRVFSSITVQKHQFYSQPSLYFQFSHPYMTAGKTIALTIWTFVGKVMSRLFTMLPRLVTASLPRSKRLFISWLQSLWWLILCHLDWAKGCPLCL